MKDLIHSTRFRLIAFTIAMLIISACGLGGGNDAATPEAPPVQPADNTTNVQEPDPVVEDEGEMNEGNENDTGGDDMADESMPDTELRTSRLVPALKDVMLRPADLKIEYRLADDREIPNDRMINQITWGDGRQYNTETQRIVGWNTYMERVPNEFAPFSYRTRIEVFETVEGAQRAFSMDWLFFYNDEKLVLTEVVSENCEYGNECVLGFHEELIAGTSDFNVEYHLVFRYRNTTVYVFVKGPEGAVTEATVGEVAELMISRLDQFDQ